MTGSDELLDTKDKQVIATVDGHPVTELPSDLFIPPDALEILLDSFTGPLDLLLYLIRKQNIDILDIPIVHITKQYIQYIQLMKETRLELAADYLVMAAVLAEIKSKMLLPVCDDEGELENEEDPRLALVRRLQAYEQYKFAAECMDELPRVHRDIFQPKISLIGIGEKIAYPEVSLQEIARAIFAVMERKEHKAHHQVQQESLSIREKMADILKALQKKPLTDFYALLSAQEGRQGVVVSFMAVLELSRQSLLMIQQTHPFDTVGIKAMSSHET